MADELGDERSREDEGSKAGLGLGLTDNHSPVSLANSSADGQRARP